MALSSFFLVAEIDGLDPLFGHSVGHQKLSHCLDLLSLHEDLHSIALTSDRRNYTSIHSVTLATRECESMGVPDVEVAHIRLISSLMNSGLIEKVSQPMISVDAFRPCLIFTTTEIGLRCPFLYQPKQVNDTQMWTKSILPDNWVFTIDNNLVPVLHVLGKTLDSLLSFEILNHFV